MAKRIIRVDLWSFLEECVPETPAAMIEIEAAAARNRVLTVLVKGYLNAGVALGIVEVIAGSPVRFCRVLDLKRLSGFELSVRKCAAEARASVQNDP